MPSRVEVSRPLYTTDFFPTTPGICLSIARRLSAMSLWTVEPAQIGVKARLNFGFAPTPCGNFVEVRVTLRFMRSSRLKENPGSPRQFNRSHRGRTLRGMEHLKRRVQKLTHVLKVNARKLTPSVWALATAPQLRTTQRLCICR